MRRPRFTRREATLRSTGYEVTNEEKEGAALGGLLVAGVGFEPTKAPLGVKSFGMQKMQSGQHPRVQTIALGVFAVVGTQV